MRNKLLLCSLLLCAVWVVAQTYPSQSSSQSSSQSGQNSAQTSGTSSSNGNEMTVRGCLSGSAGNYMLTSDSGTTYQLTGDTSKLSDHVGHTVEVKGTPTSSSSSSSGGMNSGNSSSGTGSSGTSSGSSTSGNSSGSSSGGGQQTLNVTSMKHISGSCNSSR